MQISIEPDKSKSLRLFESLLLIVCLSLLAFRCTYNESTIAAITNTNAPLGNAAFSLIISSVLIFSVVGWVLFSACCRGFQYRLTGIETGAAIFLIAGIIGIAVAANKRAAITDIVTLAAPMLMALMLVQILDSPAKIKLLLIVIIALGAVTTYQCVDQLLTGNELIIEMYEKDPQIHLDILNIMPDSFEHMLYEHRLYSKDIRGFLTTSNSVGSLAILTTFTAFGLFIEKFKNKKHTILPLLCYGVMTAVAATALVITQSRGAIAATVLGTAMFLASLAFGGWLCKHRRLILISLVLVLLCASAVAVWYGLTHGSLPGGNSMLVRWQYWAGAAKMYAQKPLTGVGGGNFSEYYTHYKAPAALETVTNPHNFILSLLSQYGPLGLIGFVAAFGLPLYKVVFAAPIDSSPPPPQKNNTFSRLAPAALAFMIVVMLIFRPKVMANDLTDQIDVIIYVGLVLYVMPVCIFIPAFWLLWIAEKTAAKTTGSTTPILKGSSKAAILCGIAAVVLHNLTDFAIFEPAVLTTFWALIAAMIANDLQNRPHKTIAPAMPARLAMIAGSLIIAFVFCRYALIPPVKASAKIHQAAKQFQRAHQLLGQAAADDPLSPQSLNLKGKLYLQQYDELERSLPPLLTHAAECFQAAIDRDSADYKNYEKLSNAYALLAENCPLQQKDDFIQKAYDCADLAVKHYPGSGRLRFALARLAEKSGKNKISLRQYETAVQIEDAYRKQFRLMYPERKMFSRLGSEKYQFAKEHITQFQE